MNYSLSAEKAIIVSFFLIAVLSPKLLFADMIPYLERDYISEGQRRKDGVVARVGVGYTLARFDNQSFDQIAFEMAKQRAILVEIRPLEKPAGVMLMASTPVGLRQYKEVWRDDDVKDVVRFWTDSYYIPSESCNPNACPKVAFVSTRGKISLRILEVKQQAFKRW